MNHNRHLSAPCNQCVAPHSAESREIETMVGFYVHDRIATDDCPAGFTVSRRAELPAGDFGITEYSWGDMALWFLDADEFTADERQEVADAIVATEMDQ